MESKSTSRNYVVEKKNTKLPTQFGKWQPDLINPFIYVLKCNVPTTNPTIDEATSLPLG
jgi:hypothetical protein